jgi:hypothetical protein
VHRTLRWAIVGLLSVAVAFGCSNPDDGDGIEPIDPSGSADDTVDDTEVADEPEAVEDPDPAPDPEPDPPAEIDVTVIPDEITLEYVDAVLIELERLYAEAAQLASARGELDLDVADRLNSIFSGELVDRRLADFLELLAVEDGFRNQDEISPSWFVASEVLDSSSACVWLVGEQDLSSLFVNGPAARTTFALLGPKDEGLVVDPNPTPWAYRQVGVGDEDALREERPC